MAERPTGPHRAADEGVVLSEHPVRTARSKQQGVLFEVYRIAGGANLYIPNPFSWEGPLRIRETEKDAAIHSLAAERERRGKDDGPSQLL